MNLGARKGNLPLLSEVAYRADHLSISSSAKRRSCGIRPLHDGDEVAVGLGRAVNGETEI